MHTENVLMIGFVGFTFLLMEDKRSKGVNNLMVVLYLYINICTSFLAGNILLNVYKQKAFGW